ncbi:unnamed protein product [Cladocopium goreaui]|uniref:Uncharacterized protein n=1 Tax=Cladocopium goreaui TaxID=2562237 RepID=A0A9P1D707_9DINO|nr:unnamed protein product [Cladocopium goreaui]
MGFLPGGTPKSSKLSEYFSNETHGDLGIPHRNPSRRRVGLLLEEFLYAFHSGIEALAGSLLVIRGRGAMDTLQESSPRARLYRRWHGCGLLGLSSLGLLVLLNGKVHDSSTWLSCSWKPFLELYWVQKSLISAALSLFHAGATGVHFLAVAESDVGRPKDAISLKEEAAMSPHLLLTVGFAAHAAGMMK